MPQARQARASGENLNYVKIAPHARQARLSGEILNYLLSRYSYILSMIIEHPSTHAETFWSMMDVDMQSTFIFFILRIQQRHFWLQTWDKKVLMSLNIKVTLTLLSDMKFLTRHSVQKITLFDQKCWYIRGEIACWVKWKMIFENISRCSLYI